MNLLALLFTLLAWLPLAVPVGILAALFLMYSKLNKGNLTSVGPLAHPPSLEPWHGQEKNFGQSGYGTSGSPTVSGAVAWTSLCSAGKICSATSPHSATNAHELRNELLKSSGHT